MQMLIFFASGHKRSVRHCLSDLRMRLPSCPSDAGSGPALESDGILMKKMVLAAVVLAMAGSAYAADIPLKAVKAPAPAPFDPWDIAFGSAIMNDYVFRLSLIHI